MKKTKVTLTMATILCAAALSGCSANVTFENAETTSSIPQANISVTVSPAPVQTTPVSIPENPIPAKDSFQTSSTGSNQANNQLMTETTSQPAHQSTTQLATETTQPAHQSTTQLATETSQPEHQSTTQLATETTSQPATQTGTHFADQASSQPVNQAKPGETFEISFDYQIKEDTGEEYGILRATGSQGTFWSYETVKCELGECSQIEELASPDGMVYLNEGGTIVALETATGNILWANTDYQGSGSICNVDEKGYVYLASHNGPALMIIDSNGNTIHRADSYGDYFWPYCIILDENKLTIGFDSEENASVTVNLTDYSYTIH